MIRLNPAMMLAITAWGMNAFVFFVWGSTSGSWSDWKMATCYPSDCFCEKPREGTLLMQPSNTWSNIWFTIFGAWLMATGTNGVSKKSPYWRLFETFTALYGFSNCVIGIGSGFYHASLTFAGQIIDNVGMYLVVSSSIIYTVFHGLKLNKPSANFGLVASYIVMNIITGVIAFKFPVSRRYIFNVLILMAVAAEIVFPEQRKAKNTKYLIAALLCFLVAFGIWNLDLRKIVCDPESVFQGHSIWHFLTAVAGYLLYLFQRSGMVGNDARAANTAKDKEHHLLAADLEQ